MKHSIFRTLFALLAASNVQLFAQEESILWFTIDGGGGESAAGSYSLHGTIGQPDASLVSIGGAFSVTGGFWSFGQTEVVGENPELNVAFVPGATGGQVRISWSPALTGFVLQETQGLLPVHWTDVGNGSKNPQVLPTDKTAKYYRLRRP